MKLGSKKERGFTLIELLVVISIISLLSSVVFASLNSARVKSRNAKRNQDIVQLRTAFNIAYNTTPAFPTTGSPTGSWYCISVTCYGGWASYSANAAVDAFLLTGIPRKPVDPADATRGYGGYVYVNPYAGLQGTGAYMQYLLEPGGTCGAGTFNQSNAAWTLCDLKLD